MKKIQKKWECWNGPTCQYNQKGRCRFSHPQHHLSKPLENTLKNPVTSWFFKKSQHFKFYKDYKEKECAICLQQFKTGKNITRLYCDHAFHYQCIQQWFQNSVACPLCKQDFRKYEKYQQFKDFKPIKEEKPYQTILNPFGFVQVGEDYDFIMNGSFNADFQWGDDISYEEQYSNSQDDSWSVHNIESPQQSVHQISVNLSVGVQQGQYYNDDDSFQQEFW